MAKRLGVGALCGVAVLLSASVGLIVGAGCASKGTAPSTPRAGLSAKPQADGAGAPATATEGKVIVHIVSQHQTVTVSSGPQGLLYSLKGEDGAMMIANATPEKFAELQPELYRNMQHYIAVHADDAPIVSAGIDPPPLPTGRRDAPVPTATSIRD